MIGRPHSTACLCEHAVNPATLRSRLRCGPADSSLSRRSSQCDSPLGARSRLSCLETVRPGTSGILTPSDLTPCSVATLRPCFAARRLALSCEVTAPLLKLSWDGSAVELPSGSVPFPRPINPAPDPRRTSARTGVKPKLARQTNEGRPFFGRPSRHFRRSGVYSRSSATTPQGHCRYEQIAYAPSTDGYGT